MKKYLLIIIAPILCTLACQKNQKDTYVPVPNPVADYFPTTAGSSWVYDVSDGGGTSYGTFTLTATNDHLQKDGKTFNILSGGSVLPVAGGQTDIYKTGGQYKNYYAILHDGPTGIDFDIPILLNRKFLNKDTSYYIPASDASKPAPWQVVLGNINPAYQDVTVKGKTYQKCILTSVLLLKRNDDASSQYYGTYQVYYTYYITFAPNVGIIAINMYNQYYSLVSSDIK